MSGFLSDLLFGTKPKKEEDPVNAPKEVELTDRIDELGFGNYQMQVWILSCGFIIAEGSEVQMASGLVSAMKEEFGVTTHVGKAMLMVWTFIGFALGTLTSGPLGDSYGRRKPMILGYCGVICTAACTVLVTNINMLYGMRALLGYFAGIGIPTACITISEVTPSYLRGRATAALGIAYILGEMWAAAGLLYMMPDLVHGSWRWLIGWAMIPAISMVLFGLLSPASRYDTPFFLGCQGRKEELRELLNLAAEMNDKPHLRLGDQTTISCEVPARIPFVDVIPSLLRPPVRMKVLVMCFLMFAKDFGFYGTDVFWPQIWAHVPGLGTLSPAQSLVATATLGIPGVLLAVFLMNVLPRKMGVYSCAAICSVCVILLRGLDDGKASAFAGVLGWKIFFPTWQMTTMLLPSELFGTQVRGWAFALAACSGRMATIISPFVVEMGIDPFTAMLACIAVGAALLVNILPETKDCNLSADVTSEPSRKSLTTDDDDKRSYGAIESAKV
jgi:AAHS family 4-hydroxybenzoate transporter-like MFS transporter